MPDWSTIISQLKGAGFAVASDAQPQPVGGGDISAAWRLTSPDGDIFVKTGPPSAGEMFAAEADGLAELSRAGAVRVPEVIATGHSGALVFLALEWLNFEAPSAATERQFGEQLAQMHRASKQRYGWHRDNTIGLTPQQNAWNDDWLGFFRERRLGYQLRLAAENGFARDLQDRGARLLRRLPIYFEATAPVPSLLHGDLWGGNWACSDGVPVIFDPAVYYGDRETDIAMTRLFGGFGQAFYKAYESSWPLQTGHRERAKLYQLYHVLNHLNLFGSAYLGRATGLIDDLL
jgi:fructosamine-3-kinase